MQIAIIGGGMAGIFAAGRLKELGHSPFIIEKSRSVGGRMATRRINRGQADHGAQFFTVRSETMQKYTDSWLEQGIVKHWFGGRYPRYTGVDGMNGFAKVLAENLDMILQEKIIRIEADKQSVTLASEDGELYFADAAVITPPVPQALELIENSALHLNDTTKAALAAGSFRPCFVGLFELEEAFEIGTHGIVDEDLPPGVDKIAANDQKGISPVPLLSVYMTGDWSTNHFEKSDEEVLTALQEAATPYLREARIKSSQLKRWKFSEALHTYNQPYLQLDDYPIYVAGDSFLTKEDESGKTRIESAALSGFHTAEAIISRFNS
ncbi:NAD(P)/FAD-dependent oxidoreductase [Alkalicoccus halolimnae]|uniref:FAD-dependent oxidoreductase n=1 Tax=Alkalicoccus halolimnae TaxID=1667239 RepID=A0A5C7F042_9BACI|nr:FAD-dependent oxidoreductase [Alkalicoccus halolimnae]TXF82326.1 deoxyribodipyrimidine photolyase [Alkalicoccus halolimnae]